MRYGTGVMLVIRSFAPTAPNVRPLDAAGVRTARSMVTAPPSDAHRQLGGATRPRHSIFAGGSSGHLPPVVLVIAVIVQPGGGVHVNRLTKPMPLVFRT